MSRRRRSGRQGAEVFGTSLADILTTALGCVLLLFLVAVMHIRGSLSAAQAELTAEADRRAQAESARVDAQRREAAAAAAARAASGAASEAELAMAALLAERDALRAERDGLLGEREALVAERSALTADLAVSRAATDAAAERADALAETARRVLGDLDPRTARPVDVMLVIDGTRSMAARLDATRRNLRATLDALRVVSPTARVGAVVFRDRREAPDLRLEQHPLTVDEAALEGFLGGIEATSTGVDDDRPEWLCGGLAAAVEARWRPSAIRLVITTSDAAADDPDAAPCIETARRFAADGGRVYVLSAPPPGYGRRRGITREHDRIVQPQHAAIAAAGGGVHVSGARPQALLTEVLRAAFKARTSESIDRLRDAMDGRPAASPQPDTPAQPAEPPPPDEDAPPAP